MFVAAGWSPTRRVAVPRQVLVGHPAYDVLAEFGGLRVGHVGSGEECASSDVSFHQVPEGNSLVQAWSRLLQTQLEGVAEVHNAHGELYMDSTGRVFEVSLIDDAFCFVGSSFTEAIERLLLGRRCRPVLKPGERRTSIYGETIVSDDPRVYRF